MIDKLKTPLITIIIGLVVMFLQKFLPAIVVLFGYGLFGLIGLVIVLYGIYLLIRAFI